ncbi:MAG: hypothetical protein FJ347_05900 [Sphingomonadales bacterium]|nr:hypothetical protein [Sphingomonadales bacterium]
MQRFIVLLTTFFCLIALSAQEHRAIKPKSWLLQTFQPGPGNTLAYSGEWQEVPYTASINELIDAGYRFLDSSGMPIKANEVENHYWRYRAELPEMAEAAKFKNVAFRMASPEPAAAYLLNGQQIGVGQSTQLPILNIIPTSTLAGENSLFIAQLPSLKDAAKLYFPLSGSTEWPADNDTANPKGSVVLRKPPVQFGWDVAPRRVLNGLGSEPEFIPFDNMLVVDVFTTVDYKPGNKAKINLHWVIRADSAIDIQLRAGMNSKSVVDTLMRLSEGQQEYIMSFILENPVLWQPNGQGWHHLYKLDLLATHGRERFMKELTFGIRDIQLERVNDNKGESFRFMVNGKPVFMKGSNLLPQQGFHSEEQRKKLWEGPNSLVNQMAVAGYNMLRVWGGGGLMPESFYKQCDELGILVWQDLMYSGTVYPYNGFWKNRALTEAVSVWKQTRQHPCMALYCGNNEIDVALKHWGWDKTYSWDSTDKAFMQDQYRQMFEEDFSRIFEKGNVNYLPSSPVSNWAPETEMARGDNHLWYVWHGERPLQDFDTKIPRFASEYGLPSWPSLECVRKYFGSDKPESRMLSYKGLKLLNGYMVTEFGALPKDTLSTILLSQYLQARVLVRAYRAHKNDSNCGGSLYWQANDIWPGITWSTVDFMGNKKAAWYPIWREFIGVTNSSFNPKLDKSYLKQVKFTAKRKGDYLTIKVGKEWLMGLMILKDVKLLDIIGNVVDLSPGTTYKVLLPENIGEIQIATAWGLLNGQGLLPK